MIVYMNFLLKIIIKLFNLINMGIVIKDNENNFIEFNDKVKFTSFVNNLHKENNNTLLNKIRNYSDAVYYLKNQKTKYIIVKN